MPPLIPAPSGRDRGASSRGASSRADPYGTMTRGPSKVTDRAVPSKWLMTKSGKKRKKRKRVLTMPPKKHKYPQPPKVGRDWRRRLSEFFGFFAGFLSFLPLIVRFLCVCWAFFAKKTHTKQYFDMMIFTFLQKHTSYLKQSLVKHKKFKKTLKSPSSQFHYGFLQFS